MTSPSLVVGGRDWLRVARRKQVIVFEPWRFPRDDSYCRHHEVPISEVLIALNLSTAGAQRLCAEHVARHLDFTAEERARVTPSVRRYVARIFSYRCHWCRRYGTARLCPDGMTWAIDHIMPIHLGGTSDLTNLCLSCPRCNREKGIQHPDDWVRSIEARAPAGTS